MSESTTQPGGRRRIDKVLAPDFAADPAGLPLDELRARRREAEQEEADLSYVRRLLQGRMDILRAELDSRRGGGNDSTAMESLRDALSEPTRDTHGLGRYLRVEPTRVGEYRRQVEQLVADIGLSDATQQSEQELEAALVRLQEYEHTVSEDRRRVQEVMDRLTAEVAERYRTGAASVDDLLAGR